MNAYEVPAADEITEPWWEATRTHRLLVQRCSCGHHQHPPRALCTRCGEMDRLGWVDATGAAVIDASTTVHRSPLPGLEAPYVVARVRLEEGPIMLTNVIDVDPAAGVPIGTVVELAWRDLADRRALPVFRPAPAATGTPDAGHAEAAVDHPTTNHPAGVAPVATEE